MINNTLVWPDAKLWEAQVFKKGRTIVYSDTNAYQLLEDTNQPPTGYPWSLIATPWTAGTYAANTQKLNGGHLWKASTTTNLSPPSAPTLDAYGRPDTVTASNGWLYVSTPAAWSSISSTIFWPADSIVVRHGLLYTTPTGTNAEPPASPWVKWKQDRASNKLKFTVSAGDAGDGDWHLYWGTPNQTLDTSDEAILSALGHPPYRNCAVIVGKNIRFGSMTTTPPDCKLLAARKPVQTLITGDATNFDADWQINPWTFLAERLTHPIFGAGLPDSIFDQTTWQAMADKCAANPERYYISPIYTSLRTLREITADIMSYADAFVFWSIIGTLTAGQWPHDEAPPAWTDANTIDMHDLTEKIADSSEGWSGTKDSVTVAFDNIQAAFNSHPIPAANLFNRAITRKLQTLKVDRPFIVRADQAALWATEMSKIAGDQIAKGTLTVRAEKATAIGPGTIFRLTDDKFGVSEAQRCTRKVLSAPPTGTVKLSYETERGLAALPYSATPDNPTAPQGPSPAPILNASFLQLPTSLAGEPNRVGVLAGRTGSNTSGFDVWFQYADGAEYQSLGLQRGFAVSGIVNNKAAGSAATDNFVFVYNHPQVHLLSHNNFYGVTVEHNSSGSYVAAAEHTDYIIVPTQGIYVTYTGAIQDGANVRVNYHYFAFNPSTSAMLGFVGFNGVDVTLSLLSTDIYQLRVIAGNGVNLWWELTEGIDWVCDRRTGDFTILGSCPNLSFNDRVDVYFETGFFLASSADVPTNDLEIFANTPTEDEVSDGKLLFFAAQASDPSKYEIMSVKSAQAVASGVYFVRVLREQFNTLAGGDGTHEFVDDVGFIIKRDELPSVTHESFPALAAAEATANFILAPRSAWVTGKITDLYDPANNPTGLTTKWNYTFAPIFPPSAELISIQRDSGSGFAVVTDFENTNVAATDILLAQVQLTDRNADMNKATLTAYLGATQVTLNSQVIEQGDSQVFSSQFSLPTPGAWDIVCTVGDQSGNKTSTKLCTLHVKTATWPLPPPAIYDFKRIGHYVKNLVFVTPNTFGGAATAGLTIEFKLVARGEASTATNVLTGDASWTTVTGTPTSPSGKTLQGPIVPFVRNTYTLWARSKKAGSNNSVTVSWNL